MNDPPATFEQFDASREVPRGAPIPDLPFGKLRQIERLVFHSAPAKRSDVLFIFGADDGPWDAAARLFVTGRWRRLISDPDADTGLTHTVASRTQCWKCLPMPAHGSTTFPASGSNHNRPEHCWLQKEPIHLLSGLANVPVLIATGEASYRAQYDHCTSAFLTQAHVENTWINLASVGIRGMTICKCLNSTT